jgi:predicted nucleic acid-binding protein
VIIADTSAMLALIDADSEHHDVLRTWYEADPDQWVLPWAILPEIDYLLATRAGDLAQRAFLHDVADSQYPVVWGNGADFNRARELCERYRDLKLGLVDASVMACAERLNAEAIATLDLRHFGVVRLKTTPLLLPRDG